MSQDMRFVGMADGLSVPNVELDRHVRELGTTGERPIIEMKSVVDATFAAGEGVLVIGEDTPDAVILLGIKQAVAIGKPFMVIPAWNQGKALAPVARATQENYADHETH
jgi:hypothetical protein